MTLLNGIYDQKKERPFDRIISIIINIKKSFIYPHIVIKYPHH